MALKFLRFPKVRKARRVKKREQLLWLDSAELEKRIKDYFSGDLKIRPIGKPIFIPTGREKVSQMPIEWKARLENNEDSRDLLFQQR